MQTHMTRVGDLGSLPDMVREACGEEGLQRISRHLSVPHPVYASLSTAVLYQDNYAFFALAGDMLGHRSVSLHLRRTDDAQNLGLYGQYLMKAPDLRTALRRTVTTPRRTREFSYQFVERQVDIVRFGYRCTFQGSRYWRHQADLMITYMTALLAHFAGDLAGLRGIEVTYPRGPYEQDLEDRFGVPVRFGSDADAILFDRSLLDGPPRPGVVSDILITRADVEMDKSTLPANLSAKLRYLIRQRLVFGRTDLEGLALKLDTGPRTIQRRLEEQGTSYRVLLEQERRARSIALLEEGGLTVDQMAGALGYATRTQFIRAFKDWTGVTPKKFQPRAFDSLVSG